MDQRNSPQAPPLPAPPAIPPGEPLPVPTPVPQQKPPGPLLTVGLPVLSLVVGALSGYFSGLLAVNKKIHDVDAKVIVLETDARTWRDNDTELTQVQVQIAVLSDLMKEINLKDQALGVLREQLQLERDRVRRETSEAIEEVLRRYEKRNE